MVTADNLLVQIEALKAKAEAHEREQARARALEERARVDLEETTAKLQTLFGISDWAEAEQLALKLKRDTEGRVEEVRSLLTTIDESRVA